MNYVFDKTWFQRHQKMLLWLLNAYFIGYWFRKMLYISENDCSYQKGVKINQINPNGFKFGQKIILADCLEFKNGNRVVFESNNKRHLYYKKGGIKIEKHLCFTGQWDFRTRNKFSIALYRSFYPLWWTFHQWDILIANRFQPAWNLGFDTLTVYPDPNVETTSVDGDVGQNGVDLTLSNIRASAGNEANPTSAGANGYTLFASTTSGQYQRLYRWIFLYDTSALGAGATVSAAVHSTWIGGNGKIDNLSGQASANSVMVLVASTPATNTDLVSGDYAQTGSTDFGRSAKQDSVSSVAYNDITVNASGIAAISKTGVTKYALRVGWDFDNTTTGLTWSSGGKQGYDIVFADTALTVTDPKLVITYTSTINYTLALAQGSYTLTGQALGMTKALHLTCAQGSYVLTGIAATIGKGYTLALAMGSYVLTGISLTLTKALRITCAQGSYTLTGQALGMTRQLIMTMSTGYYAITGFATLFLGWFKRVKPSRGTYTPRTKPSVGTWTKRTKPTH